eukprot:PLAT7072.1.p1 GENE.PLAT7072.1~~PLAT7072.1.p1  ORF type:complete len:458 (+),score=162.18 PLAT7072.1:92-1375(+)
MGAAALYVHADGPEERATLPTWGDFLPPLRALCSTGMDGRTGGSMFKDGAVQVARRMMPADANTQGNVHGGTLLKLIEQAGATAVTRHANSLRRKEAREKGEEEPPRLWSATAHLDHVDFFAPVYVGEMCYVTAELGYVSRRSMEVLVTVYAENLLEGTRRLTNRATLTYVAFSEEAFHADECVAQELPQPQSILNRKLWQEGEARYAARRAARAAGVSSGVDSFRTEYSGDAGLGAEPVRGEIRLPPLTAKGAVDEHGKPIQSPGESAVSLTEVMYPVHGTSSGHVLGGVIMKLMDGAAGVVAHRHCRSATVTACLDALDFYSPVFVGTLLHVNAKLNFVSSKSMEIAVTVDAEIPSTGELKRSNSALFTFVSLDKDGSTQPVPPLALRTDGDRLRFALGQRRYEMRKAERRAKAAAAAAAAEEEG